MPDYLKQVIDAHVAIQRLFSQGADTLDSLAERFDQDFTLITTAGTLLDRATVLSFLQAQVGARPGLLISISEAQRVTEWQDGAVVRYREVHTLPGGQAQGRYATVLFRQRDGRALWQHLHETSTASA